MPGTEVNAVLDTLNGLLHLMGKVVFSFVCFVLFRRRGSSENTNRRRN
jgi:hypothetical protein